MATQGVRHGAGVVISAGKMNKTVTVRMVRSEYNKHLRKNYYKPYKFLVHDPNNSVFEGDVITCTPERHSNRVSHVVSSILAPFSKPLDERSPIPTESERLASKADRYRRKNERRAVRGNSISTKILQENGWTLSAPPEELRAASGAEENKPGQTMEHGRTVLPDGTHKYGARGEGGIEKEAWRNKQKAMDLEGRALQNEAEREAVQGEDSPAR